MKRLQSGEALVVDAYDRDQQDQARDRQAAHRRQPDRHRPPARSSSRREFANDDLALFPNQFVNVRMLVQTLRDATLVPTAAIQRGAPGTFVYVVKDDQHGHACAGEARARSQGEVTAIASGRRAGRAGGRRRRRQAARRRQGRADHARRAGGAGRRAKAARPRGDRPPRQRPPRDGKQASKDGG